MDGIKDILHTIIQKISNSFHTEGELNDIKAQVDALKTEAEADAEKDVAEAAQEVAPDFPHA